MDIFEYAMEKELYAQNYYQELAEKSPYEGMKYILSILANEEKKHYDFVKNLKEGSKELPPASTLGKDIKATFQKMRDSKEKFSFEISQVELYKKAQEIEMEAKKHYLDKMEELENEEQKKIFKIFADEEQGHYDLLQNIIDFVSRPDTWLENAEFNHIKEAY